MKAQNMLIKVDYAFLLMNLIKNMTYTRRSQDISVKALQDNSFYVMSMFFNIPSTEACM